MQLPSIAEKLNKSQLILSIEYLSIKNNEFYVSASTDRSSRKADKGRAVATDWLAPHWPRVGMSMNHPWMNGIQGGYTSVIGSKEQEATAFSFLRALLASK